MITSIFKVEMVEKFDPPVIQLKFFLQSDQIWLSFISNVKDLFCFIYPLQALKILRFVDQLEPPLKFSTLS